MMYAVVPAAFQSFGNIECQVTSFLRDDIQVKHFQFGLSSSSPCR